MDHDPLLTRYSIIGRLGQDDAGPSRQWELFYDLYQSWICAIAARCNLRPHEVDEVLQETMTTMLRLFRAGKYDPNKGRFRAFLSCIVRQHVKQAMFRRARHEARTRPIEGEQTQGGTPLTACECPDGKPLPDEQIEVRMRLGLVEVALQELVRHDWVSQKRADIFVALTFDDKTPEQVAQEFGTNRNNVDAAKHAVRQKLKLMIRCKEEAIDPADVDPAQAPRTLFQRFAPHETITQLILS